MSTTTTNYELVKPELSDVADITQMNPNWDKLDQTLKTLSTNTDNHASNKSNPHGVTKAQVGLGNADNTKDSDKSVKYAGTAGKLGSTSTTTSQGSATKPVYFKDGVPVEITHEVNATVPSNAKFTDTTYGTGNTTTSGLTKLYTSTGSNTDGTITQAKLTSLLNEKSDGEHTHNYAGSSSAGGAATTALACTGNSATATKATNDSEGHKISEYYLPRSGGQMSGGIYSNSNNEYMIVCGGEDVNSGGYIRLHSKDDAENLGRVVISANNGTNKSVMRFFPNGDLSIDDKKVITSDGGVFTVGHAIKRDVDSSYIGMYGGTDSSTNARVEVMGKNHEVNPGEFHIYAQNDTNSVALRGKPDGTLTWNAQDVITGAGGTLNGTLYRNGLLATSSSPAQSLWLASGGDVSSGASIYAYGKDASINPGGFRLRAHDGSSYKDLVGKPDGTLTWGGKTVPNIDYMPSTSKITISLSGDQQDYTVPADGWISVSCKTTVSSCIQAFALVNNANNMQISQTMHAKEKMARGFMPVSKGHNITIYWASDGTNTRSMEFVHVNG